MAVHSDGLGSGWLEDLDIDQPYGLDYREFNDLRIGIRKRMSKEHVSFGDTTAGGEHLPGRCGVLLVCDNTADFTAYVDATTAPLGSMAYCITHANLWCMTGTASGGSPDFTIVKLGPLSFCLGADYTWDGAHLFDASCDFSDVAINGSVFFTSCATDFGGFLDEDDMSSDATASIASQQSIKAFVELLAPQAWVVFNGTDASPITPKDSYGVTSVTWSAAGKYRITWSTAFSTAFYCCFMTSAATHIQINAMTATYVDIWTLDGNHNAVASGLICVGAIGTQ